MRDVARDHRGLPLHVHQWTGAQKRCGLMDRDERDFKIAGAQEEFQYLVTATNLFLLS
jgi:hypothetical protein